MGALSPVQAVPSPPEAFAAYEQLWSVRGHILRILTWAFCAAIWLLCLGVLALTTLYYSPVYPYLFLFLLGGGVVIAIFGAVYAILPSRRAATAIEDWERTMLPFVYTIKFELLPVTDADRLIDIWDRYKGIYRSFTEISVPHTGSRFFDSLKLQYNYQAKGKKARHTFGIYAASNDFVLLVRRFTDEGPVERNQVDLLRQEAEDVLERVSVRNFRVGAFSRSGFTEEAIAFSRSDEGRVLEGPPVDLIRETETGYAIVSVVTSD